MLKDCIKTALNKSSRLEVFCKKDNLKNFAKFTGKHLCQSLFFNKVAGLRSATFFKKRFWHRCFSMNFAKFLKALFFIEHLRWLLLIKYNLGSHKMNTLANKHTRKQTNKQTNKKTACSLTEEKYLRTKRTFGKNKYYK